MNTLYRNNLIDFRIGLGRRSQFPGFEQSIENIGGMFKCEQFSEIPPLSEPDGALMLFKTFSLTVTMIFL